MDITVKHTRAKGNSFKEALLDKETFCITWEQVPGRGASEKERETILLNAAAAARGGRVHAISITDSPGGSPTFSSATLGIEIRRLGIESLVHLALRDKNRNEIESLLYGLAAKDVRNLLVLSGDYPARSGFEGRAQPVFDLDPVHVMQLIHIMNEGLEYDNMGQTVKLAPTEFFSGVAVSPFKQTEPEIMCQYYKLAQKIESGARFVISQIGFDARKMDELVRWVKYKSYDIPVIANIYVLTYPAAKLMSVNRIPGCVVTDKLLQQLADERKSADKGKTARLLRAAKMYAIAKGIGYKGVHIGGHNMNYEMVEYVLEKGEDLYPRWDELVGEFDYPQDDGFYFFRHDGKSGLNNDIEAERNYKGRKTWLASFSRTLHTLFFDPRHPLFRPSQRFIRFIDRHEWARKPFEFIEHQVKGALFGCLHCGDCSLVDTGYLCTTSQCPKGERLGPCGGSFHGWCEVYPGKRRCVWVRSYSRLKAYHAEQTLGKNIIPPRNWDLWNTSSLISFYMGRDHTSKRLNVRPPEEKK